MEVDVAAAGVGAITIKKTRSATRNAEGRKRELQRTRASGIAVIVLSRPHATLDVRRLRADTGSSLPNGAPPQID